MVNLTLLSSFNCWSLASRTDRRMSPTMYTDQWVSWRQSAGSCQMRYHQVSQDVFFLRRLV